jgi:hypothetical protein
VRSPSRLVASALAALAAVAIGACGGDDSSETPDGGSVGDGVAISIVPDVTDEAPSVIAVPASFPAEVPLPDDIELAEADELAGATTIYDITGWHPGAPVPLGEAYLARLRAAGFEIVSRSDAADSVLFLVIGEEWFVSSGFYPDPVRNTGTSIGVTVGPASSAPVTD